MQMHKNQLSFSFLKFNSKRHFGSSFSFKDFSSFHMQLNIINKAVFGNKVNEFKLLPFFTVKNLQVH